MNPASVTSLPSNDLNTNIVQIYTLGTIAGLGIAGFIFALEEESILRLETIVTDNWVQAGYNIQDNVAIKPMEFTIRGKVSEIERRKTSLSNLLQGISKTVTGILQFQTVLTNTSIANNQSASAQNAINTSNTTLSNTYTGFLNIYQSILSSFALFSNQGRTWAFFEALARSRTLIAMQTPWRFISSMLITKVEAISPMQSNYHSDFEIQVKEFRSFAPPGLVSSTLSAPGTENLFTPPVNQGSSAGSQKKTNDSLVNSILG